MAIADDVARALADDFDLVDLVALWTQGGGAPAPPETFDENPLLATAALVVLASESGQRLRVRAPTPDALAAELTGVLARAIAKAPRGHRQLLAPRTGEVGATPGPTIDRVVAAVVDVLFR